MKKNANILDDNDWPTILQGEISVSYDNLCSLLEQTVTDNIPLKSRKNNKKNLYMNRNAIKMKDRKNQLWKTSYYRTKSHQDSQKFKRCRDELRCLTRQLRISFENKLMKNIKKKPKSFWRYANSRLKTRILIPTLIKSDGTKAETSLDKAEELNNHVRSVFISEDTNTIPVSNKYFNGEKLIIIEITTEMVTHTLLKLKDNKPPGPDEIHPYFIMKLANCDPYHHNQ